MARASSASQNTAHTVFVSTNLSTNLMMMVTDEDTVREFKKKVSTEHCDCYPHIGEITVRSLKVKRKGCLYHLPNSVLVKSAFVGVSKTWFLHVDAVSCQVQSLEGPLYLEAGANVQPEILCVMDEPSAEDKRNAICVDRISQKFSSLDDSAEPQDGSSDLVNKLVPLFDPNNVGVGMTNVENLEGKFLLKEHHKSSSLDDDKRLGSDVLEKHDFATEGNDVPKTDSKCKKDKSRKRKKESSCDRVFGDDVQSGPVLKRPKFGKTSLQENHIRICMSNGGAYEPENILHDNVVEGTKIRNAKLDDLSNKQEDDISSSHNLHNGETEMKINSSVVGEKEDSTRVCSKENAGRKSSKVESRINHEEFSKDVDETSPQQMTQDVILEKEIHSSEVEKLGDGISIPCSSIGDPRGKSATLEAVADVDLDSFQDVDMGGTNGSKLESRGDISEKTLVVGGRKTKKLKKHQAANVNEAEMDGKDRVASSNPLDAGDITETKVPGNKRKKKSKKTKDADAKSHLYASNVEDSIPLIPSHEKSIDGVCHAVGVNNDGSILSLAENEQISKPCSSDDYIITAGIDKVEAEKNITLNEDHNMVPGTTSSIKDTVAGAASSDAIGATEAKISPDKRKKKSKKTKVSNAKTNVTTSVAEHVERAGDAIQSISESKEGYTILSQTEGVKASRLESLNSLHIGFDNKDSEENGHKDNSVQLAQVASVPEGTHNLDDKVKRKSNKPPVSSSNTIMNPEIKQSAANTDEPTFSSKRNKEEVKLTTKRMRKSKSKKDNSVNQLSDGLPEAEKDSRFSIESLQDHHISGNVGSSPAPQTSIKDNVDRQHLGNGSTDGAEDYVEAPISSVEVNFRDYFVSRTDSHEGGALVKEPVVNDIQQTRYDEELNVKKKTKPRNVHSGGTTPELDNTHDSIHNQGRKKKTHSGTLDTFQPPKRKPYTKRTGDGPNTSQNQKSLLAAPNTVFSDSGTETSEDKDGGIYNSDASTKSPSDSSSSSDHSEGENGDSPGNGSDGRKLTENVGESKIKLQNTDRKNMDLGTILRSSRSYKKAKFIASQSQPEETESQPIEFILDSR